MMSKYIFTLLIAASASALAFDPVFKTLKIDEGKLWVHGIAVAKKEVNGDHFISVEVDERLLCDVNYVDFQVETMKGYGYGISTKKYENIYVAESTMENVKVGNFYIYCREPSKFGGYSIYIVNAWKNI